MNILFVLIIFTVLFVCKFPIKDATWPETKTAAAMRRGVRVPAAAVTKQDYSTNIQWNTVSSLVPPLAAVACDT